MLGIEAVHQNRIHHEQHHKADNRTLLRHPKTKRRVTNLRCIRIEPLTKYDTTAKADREPNGQQAKNEFEASPTMGLSMIIFHVRKG